MKREKIPVFSLLLCGVLLAALLFFTVPVPADTSAAASISGNIALETYGLSAGSIDQSQAVITWGTNDYADSTVEYGTTTAYGSSAANATLTESHSIALSSLSPGTVYHYQVISVNGAGAQATSADATFTTLPVPVTETPTASGGGGGGGGGGSGGGNGGGSPPANLAPLSLPQAPAELLAPPEQVLSDLAGLLSPSANPGNTGPAVSASYPIGFSGMNYNGDGHGSLFIDGAAAQNAGATITVSTNFVDVYQHHSPGVHSTFWGQIHEDAGGNITGQITRAEFATDPMNATLSFGNVSGAIHAVLPALYQQDAIPLTLSGSVSPDTLGRLQDLLAGQGLILDSVAYSFNVQRSNLTTGAANVTLTVPASWVDAHGGKDAVRITRISKENGDATLLTTVYGGTDAQGTMTFRGASPDAGALFTLVTTAAPGAAGENGASLAGTIDGLSSLLHNPVVLIGICGVLVMIIALAWWWRKQQEF